MMRTQAQRRLRRSIANAAAGRTAVVLYASTAGSDIPARDVLSELRRYADAREWQIAEEVLDDSPLTLPLKQRAAWRRVRDLITSGHAEGVIAPTAHARDDVPEERAALDEWLADRGAFLSLATVRPVLRGGCQACQPLTHREADAL